MFDDIGSLLILLVYPVSGTLDADPVHMDWFDVGLYDHELVSRTL